MSSPMSSEQWSHEFVARSSLQKVSGRPSMYSSRTPRSSAPASLSFGTFRIDFHGLRRPPTHSAFSLARRSLLDSVGVDGGVVREVGDEETDEAEGPEGGEHEGDDEGESQVMYWMFGASPEEGEKGRR